jgi:hypothetical protein
MERILYAMGNLERSEHSRLKAKSVIRNFVSFQNDFHLSKAGMSSDK